MQEEESIYNIIPKTPVPLVKSLRYKSKFPCTIPPSYSTLGLHTTSKPGVSNVGGDLQQLCFSHSNVSASAVFGPTLDRNSLSPSSYLRKGTGPSILVKSLDANVLKHVCMRSKEKIPKHNEHPIHGLKSHKNFILANAVENILAAPTIAKEEQDWLKKKDFAKIPTYLQKVKEHLQVEYETVRESQMREEEQKMREKYPLTQEEIDQIKNGLKQRWDHVNRKFQNYAHITKIDSVGLKRRKETYEKELVSLERDMEKLNKHYIFVDTTIKTGKQ